MSPAVAAMAVSPTPARPARPARLRPAPAPAAERAPARRSAAAGALAAGTEGSRAVAAPTRERLRAVLGGAGEQRATQAGGPASAPQTTAARVVAPSTRDRVSAGLRETPAQGASGGSTAGPAAIAGPAGPTGLSLRVGGVVDLAGRRTAAESRRAMRDGGEGGSVTPDRLAEVIPFPVRPPGSGTSASGIAGPRPAATAKDGAIVTRPARGPPPGGPRSDHTVIGLPAPAARAVVDGGTTDPGTHLSTDPGLLAFQEGAEAVVVRITAHQRGKPAADNAQSASAPDPVRDVDSQAASLRVQDMATRQPGEFDPETFKAEVRKTVEAIAPPVTLEDVDEFRESGKAGAATTVAQSLVAQRHAATQHDIATGAAMPPDREGLTPKPVGRMINDAPGTAPGSVGAAGVVPGPRPHADVDLSSGPAGVDAAMAERSLSVDQLANANEPAFSAVLTARQDVVAHAAEAQRAYRDEEAGVLSGAAERITADEASALTGMYGSRVGALGAARWMKGRTKDDDQRRRDDVNAQILGIHRDTKDSVESLLRTLDTTVPAMFAEGEAYARDVFERYVASKMAGYKHERYGGWGGGALWLKDKLFDLPDEVNDFYVWGREIYLFNLGRTIDSIAAYIGLMLTAATYAIKFGRLRIQNLLLTLPKDLVKLGTTTAAQLDNRFDLLTADVTAAKDRMVDTVARAYVDATGKLDARIEELKEQNKGLVTRAVDFVKKVAGIIADLGRLLARVLLKAVSVIGDILAHPIRFFENLIDAIGSGLSLFKERFGRHLEDALVEFLFGKLAASGITLPPSLDFAGVFDLVTQVLGLTWADIRGRLVNRLGLPVVQRMEQVVDVFRLLVTRGVGGLWELAKQRLSDLQERIVGVLRTYIVEQVVKAGLAYVASLLTPVSAFIKACQGIYRIVSFIVEKAKEIAAFVESVLDSIAAIAAGDVRSAAERIDGALARALELAIGFLAKLAHVDAVGDKSQSVIRGVRTPVKNAVDSIVDAAVGVYQATLGRRRGDERIAIADVPKDATGPPAGAAVIDVPVRLHGVTHHLRDDGPGRALELHSDPLLVNSIQNPVLQGMVARFNAATAQAVKHQLAVDIAQWIATNMPATGPGGSAPNLGRIGRHGSQPPRLEDQNVPLWSLRSEHVVPFAVVRGLWEALGVEANAKRKQLGTEDAELTTIMIYKGAGDRKDVGEGGRRSAAAAQLARMTAAYVQRPDADTPAADAQFARQVMAVLQGERQWFAGFTWQQVQAEHAAVSGGSTHGGLRQETVALPSLGDIDRAAGMELADADDILQGALRELSGP